MAQTQGGRANLTGNRLEQNIENNLLQCGFRQMKESRRFSTMLANLDEPSYCRQTYIGKTIYDTDLKCDFMLFHPQKWPEGLVIEAKWQQVGGSVDEKFPYLVFNIFKSELRTILILDGNGYRPGAERWLRSMQKQNLLHVFSLAEFLIWVNGGNL